MIGAGPDRCGSHHDYANLFLAQGQMSHGAAVEIRILAVEILGKGSNSLQVHSFFGGIVSQGQVEGS